MRENVIVFMEFTISILIFYLMGFIKRSGQNSTWLDCRYTTALKGFAVLTVIWAHGSNRIGIGGIQFIAGIGVALFLILSGYGMERSFASRGLKGFWLKRFMRICLPIYIIELIWEIISKNFSLIYFLRRGIFMRAGGWYIKFILICYVAYYLVKLLSLKIDVIKKYDYVILFIVFIIFFVVECIWPDNKEIPFLRARQMLSFPVGVYIGKNKDQISKITRSKILMICSIILIGGLLMMAVTQISVVQQSVLLLNVLSLFTVFPLALAIIGITKEWMFIINNNCFFYLGIVSYELYLTQIYTQDFINNSYVSIMLYLALTIIGAILLHLLTNIKGIQNKRV